MKQLIEPFSEILPKALNDLHVEAQFHQKAHGCGAYSFTDGAGLFALCQVAKPKRILELGCGYGYTCVSMAWGLPDVHIDTIDADIEHVKLACENIEKLEMAKQIKVHCGYFDDVIEKLNKNYDLVFFDGYEPSLALLKKLTKKLNDNGLLVCANVALASRENQKNIRDMLDRKPLSISEVSLEKGATLVSIKHIS